MKIKTIILTFATLLISGIFFFQAGCKKDETPKVIKGPATFSQNSVFIEKSTWNEMLVSIDTLNGVFNFDADPGLSVGDIMITEEGEGWIRKVTAVQNTSGGIVVNTEFASLCDAVEEVTATINKSVLPDKKSGWVDLAEGVTIHPDPKNTDNTNLNVNFDWVIYDRDGNLNTKDDQLTLSGLYGLTSEVEAEIEIKNFDLKKLVLTYTNTETASLSVSTEVELELFSKEKMLMRNNSIPPIILFPGCVIKPVIELWAGIDVTNTGEFSVEVEKTKDYVSSLTYENGSWSTDKTINQNETSLQPSLTNTATAKAYLKPKLLFKINGVISPKLEADLYNQFEAIASLTGLDWELSMGFDLGIGIEMKIFKKTLLNYTFNFFDIKGILTQGSIDWQNNKPVAAFSGNPTSGNKPLTVSFTDQSTNTPTSWSWNFGDGNTSTQQNPSHTYQDAGNYTVQLTATNSYGSNTKTRNNYITVNSTGQAPIAAFTANPTSGNKPLTVSFTDQSTNTPTSWSWNFGDGNTSTQQNPSHTYQDAGNYTVQLYVSNAYGNDTKTISDYISVSTGGSTGEPCPGMPTVTDYDGNVYNTVLIGNQCWMAENLEVTHYRDGTDIPNVTGNSAWAGLSTGAYCWYNNEITWKDSYGALYNWYAVDNSSGLCPTGWHVPSDPEWTTLTTYAGGESIAGGKLKSTRTSPDSHPRWNSPNTGATNVYGFAALPGGYRDDYDGTFNYMGYLGYWWSSTAYSSTYAWYRNMGYNNDDVYRYNDY